MPRGDRDDRMEKGERTTPAPDRSERGLRSRSGTPGHGNTGSRGNTGGRGISGAGSGGISAGSPSGNRGVGPRPPAQANPQQSMRPVKKTWRDWRPNQIVLRRNQVLTLGLVTALVILIAVAGVYKSMTAEEAPVLTGADVTTPKETQSAATTVPLKGRMGAFTQTDSAAYDEFEKWWGMDLTYVVDFGDRKTWEQIANPAHVLDTWNKDKYRLVLGVPMLPDELLDAGMESWDEDAMPVKKREMAKGGDGDYDQYFTELGENLVAAGQEDAILRVGWEMNIESWMWGIDDPKIYVKYYKQIVDTMREVPGNKFEFDWNVNNGYNPNSAPDYYPGDKYLDYVGVDVYDLHKGNYPYPKKCSQACREEMQTAAWEQNIFGGPTGLSFWTTFAAEHGKPVSIPEWALWDRVDNTGGADNPLFIQFMHDYLTRSQNNVAYANYFEANSAQGDHMLTESFPKSAKVFKELFSPKK
ncbi:glycoside hydrolase family 26 protein [Kineosporia babensis]|uniref:GH26 domain-containing protein n=1 Tax=Kineosporia babensis TaxID=499548 RepID=A0A9X1STR8_9ACTN|nr:glycosyl hydrolase [Kineosporia babensis]MCD5312219.1 hypothetical protein [Kineosporia babensis]